MKELTMIVVLAFVILAVATTGLQAFDASIPGVVAAREQEAAARAELVAKQTQIDAVEYRQREAAATVALVIALIGAGMGTAVVALAGAIGAGRWLNTRARLVQPNEATALYPGILIDGVPVTFNQPGAQIVAAMAVARRRPTAAMLEQIMAPPPPVELLPPPVELLPPPVEATQVELPTVVPVYRADLPNVPALMVGVGAHGPVALPLHNLGNVLVGGVPGSGKTECLASMLAGLLRFDATGATVRLGICDPKMVDFGGIPNDLQALMWPVAKTVEDAGRLIAACRVEVERRFALLDAAGARNLAQFNAAHADDALPYLVTVVDELADLTGDGTFVQNALHIGRKGRAAGVSLVLATQRPSSDVVPSSLRAVCGAQIAFRLLNSRDSSTVLGVSGAETLPNVPGRCLVRRSTIETVQSYHADLERRFYPFVGRLPRGDVKQLPAPTQVERLPPVATGGGASQPGDFAILNRLPPVEVDAVPVERIARGRRPTPAQAAQIRQLHATGWSANRLSQRFWGYKDSDTLRFIREVLH